MRYENYNEYELLYLARNGSDKAIHIFFELYKAFFLSLFKEVKDKYSNLEYDEFMQYCYLGALQAIYYYRCDMKLAFHNFLIMCVKREVVSQCRKIKHDVNSTYALFSLDDEIDDAEGINYGELLLSDDSYRPDYNFRYTYTLETIYKILGNNQIDRNVYALRVQGYSYKEIANFLKIKQKAVDNSMQRIRQKLSTLFD